MIRTAAVVSLLSVGPALAGDSVMWGETGRTGALRVMQAAPGQDPVLVHRVPPHRRRTLAGLEASSERFAVKVSTIESRSEDVVAFTLRAWGGPFKGPVEPVRAPCGRADTIAVDGDRIAGGSTCGVAIHGPAGVTTIPGGDIHEVALAGRYVAWTGDEVAVHDVVTGATVVRLTPRDVGSPAFEEVAVQPDGAVAFSYATGAGQHLAWAAPGTPGARRLDTAPRFSGLRAAGGRLLYERRTGPREGRRVLVLRSPEAGPARRLARFTARRVRIGDLDLEPGRAAWAVRRQGRAVRIVVREL